MADWTLFLLPLLALPIVLLFRFLGCTPFGSTVVGEGVPGFEVSVAPTATGVTQGASRTVTVTVTSADGFNAPVTLGTSGLASGVSAAFGTNPVTPPVNGNATSILTLEASASAPTGPGVVTITGTTPNAGQPAFPFSKSVTLDLTVSPGVSDFSLSLTPATRTVPRGQTTSFTVNITRVGGFSAPVALTVNPAGPSTLAPSPAPGNTSTLTVPVAANTPPGTYPFTVTGAGGGQTHTTGGTVVVTN